MSELIQRSISGVFCDDIRDEVSGKKSLIGCYGPVMEVGAFPASLSKLCIHSIIQTPGDKPFREVKLVVLRDDDVLAEGDIPIQMQVPGSTASMLRMDVEFVFSPVQIEKACTFRVRAFLDGQETRGLALEVREMSASNQSVGPETAAE